MRIKIIFGEARIAGGQRPSSLLDSAFNLGITQHVICMLNKKGTKYLASAAFARSLGGLLPLAWIIVGVNMSNFESTLAFL